MRALLYTILAGVLLALAMVVSGPHIKSASTQWRATHKPISTMQEGARYFAARLVRA